MPCTVRFVVDSDSSAVAVRAVVSVWSAEVGCCFVLARAVVADWRRTAMSCVTRFVVDSGGGAVCGS